MQGLWLCRTEKLLKHIFGQTDKKMQGQSREKELRDSFDTLVQKLINSQIETLQQSTPNHKVVKLQDKFLEDLSLELKVLFLSNLILKNVTSDYIDFYLFEFMLTI